MAGGDVEKESIGSLLSRLRVGQVAKLIAFLLSAIGAYSFAVFKLGQGSVVVPPVATAGQTCEANPDWPRGEWLMTKRDRHSTDHRTADRVVVDLASGFQWKTTLQKLPVVNANRSIRAGDYLTLYFGSHDPGYYSREESLRVSVDGCRMSGDFDELIRPPGWKDGDPETKAHGTVLYEWLPPSDDNG